MNIRDSGGRQALPRTAGPFLQADLDRSAMSAGPPDPHSFQEQGDHQYAMSRTPRVGAFSRCFMS
jgi:hypothetical protein